MAEAPSIMTRKWSDQQVAIFDWFKNGKGNLIVEACAGTGKTTTMVEAVRYAPEKEILFGAFNKKIADELKQKLPPGKGRAQTFHSAGLYYAGRMFKPKKVVLDEDKGTKNAGKALDLTMPGAWSNAPKDVIQMVERLAALGKNCCPLAPTVEAMTDLAYDFDITPEEHHEEEGYTLHEIVRAAIKAMELAKNTKDGVIDYDDMIFVPLANNRITPWYDLVIIDEAQDMNMSQLLEAQRLCKRGGRIVVVGDSRQAIYGFRGATSDSIQRLKTELKATELRLTITYRCPKKVVEVARQIVPYYEAAPTAPEGTIDGVNFDKMAELADKGDFVLSRKNAPLAKVCMRFLRLGKKAMIEGKEIGAGLCAIIKNLRAKDMEDFFDKLGKWEDKSCAKLAKVQKKSAERRIEYIHDQAETLRHLGEDAETPADLALKIEGLFTQTSAGKADFILCSSVHRAKGLESNRVFVLQETLYPGGNHDVEEQNIEYVAVTRAKQTLVWVNGIS